MIEFSQGNLLTAAAEALVNTVNTEGVMGKGIALQFARAFPEMLPSYEAACRAGELAPGRMHVFERGELVDPRYIINFPTKRHWRGKSRLADIDAGLVDLVRVVRERGIRSIALPPLGCGLGGLRWDDVRPRIETAFAALPDVRVMLYAPAGAPVASAQPNRTQRPALTAARARVIEVLAAYLGLGYELSLLEVHKLLYFLQAAGEPLKLRYAKGRYGPYADNLRQVLSRFEGHYTTGYGDGSDKPDTEIELLPGAQEAAAAFLAQEREAGETDTRLERVVELIEGFESPYGMELLATVHWVAANDDPAATTLDEAVERIHAWTMRKQRTMPREHIELAWNRLRDLGWLGTPAPTPSHDAHDDAEPYSPGGRYEHHTREQLIRLLQRRDAERQLGLVWERDEIEADRALNDDFVALELDPALSHGDAPWDNLIIEGDNFDALRYLRMTHAGRIRCIYIDPPYNTGNRDFVYNDRFVDKSHRFRHSLWLEFMYRRLTLARDLLADDGVIFVSIDDNEMFRLGMLMDRVFGEENFVASVIWQKMDSPKNTARHFSDDHEYVLVYSRDKSQWHPNRLPRSEAMTARYKNPDSDPRGAWLLSDLAARNFYSLGTYAIETPSGRTIEGPPVGNYWRVSKEKFDELNRDGRIWWGKTGNNRPGIKRFLNEVRDGVVPQTLWTWKEVGSTRHSKQELNAIMGEVGQTAFFGTPKPLALMTRILELATKRGDIVLDFFAGSGTLAQAVAKLNAEDGGDRRFILVSNTEATEDQPGKNLCRDVCAERVRRVMRGYTNAKGEAVTGLGGGFAYLRARRVPRHRLERRLGHAEIWNALQLIHDLPLQTAAGDAPYTRGDASLALAYLPEWRELDVAGLRDWCARRTQARVIVYSWTPERLADLPSGIDLRPIPESLRLRFGGSRA
ncbi:MAG TPA: DNA methyltransferase [Dokdonella sp.]|nr:DNA methyltransferase [Dokdonella sp.]